MLWFKHHSNFRNSPQIKLIQSRLGCEGVAAVYRLNEVMTEHFGRTVRNEPVLTLSSPYSEWWLAEELYVYNDRDEDNQHDNGAPEPDVKKLRKFLAIFQQAGIIVYRVEKGPGATTDGEGAVVVKKDLSFTTIRLLNFAGQVDEYNQKKARKGLGTPDAIET